eukprot:14848966-Alexandrium_andersonii.AAC.1
MAGSTSCRTAQALQHSLIEPHHFPPLPTQNLQSAPQIRGTLQTLPELSKTLQNSSEPCAILWSDPMDAWRAKLASL